MRWWPVRDPAGNLIADTYWMIMDTRAAQRMRL